MTVATSRSLRIELATTFMPRAVDLLSAIAVTAVLCLFCALGVTTLAHGPTMDGWQAAYGAAVLLTEGLCALLALEATMDASVRLGVRAEAAVQRWCEGLDG